MGGGHVGPLDDRNVSLNDSDGFLVDPGVVVVRPGEYCLSLVAVRWAVHWWNPASADVNVTVKRNSPRGSAYCDDWRRGGCECLSGEILARSSPGAPRPPR